MAPARAACGPAGYGGSGTRCAPTTATGERKPRASTASPAADQPIRPHSATRSPGRAPARVTGARPSSEPSAVTDTTSAGAAVRSPPTSPTPTVPASAHSPSASPDTTSNGVSGGQASPTSNAVGTAPMAAMSARLAAAAFRPTCSGVDQSSRKCTPSTSTSVLATTRPSGAATTAASSPGPEQGGGRLGPPRGHPGDHPELPDGGQRVILRGLPGRGRRR